MTATHGHHDWIVDDRSDPRVQREEYFVQARSRESHDLTGTFGEGSVHKFLFIGESEAISAAEQTAGAPYPMLNVVRSNDILCEIMTEKATKNHAVEILCDHFKVSRFDAVAFGDGPNDLDTLSAVDQSYAMISGEDAVKASAAHVCKWTNTECGVAHPRRARAVTRMSRSRSTICLTTS